MFHVSHAFLPFFLYQSSNPQLTVLFEYRSDFHNFIYTQLMFHVSLLHAIPVIIMLCSFFSILNLLLVFIHRSEFGHFITLQLIFQCHMPYMSATLLPHTLHKCSHTFHSYLPHTPFSVSDVPTNLGYGPHALPSPPDAHVLTSDSLVEYRCQSAQQAALALLTSCGPAAIVNPEEAHAACVFAGLIPSDTHLHILPTSASSMVSCIPHRMPHNRNKVCKMLLH